jgi:hypothetical protein
MRTEHGGQRRGEIIGSTGTAGSYVAGRTDKGEKKLRISREMRELVTCPGQECCRENEKVGCVARYYN